MKNKAPAFQFYPKDYLSDEKVSLLTAAEEGFYWRAMCHCWLEGSIPANPEKLAWLLGKGCVAELLVNVVKLFKPSEKDPERLVNIRLDKERKLQQERSKERSVAGKNGAKSRWGKGLSSMAQPSVCYSSAIDLPMAKNGSASASTTASTSTDLNTNTLPAKKPKPLNPTEGKVQHGEEGFVWLKPVELERLVAKFGQKFADECIETLDSWIGKQKSKDRITNGINAAATFRSWVIKSVQERNAPAPKQAQLGFKPHTAASTVEKNEQYIKETYGEEFFNQMLASPGFGEEELDFKPTGGSSVALLPEGTTKRIGN